jgi:hypothetical protein
MKGIRVVAGTFSLLTIMIILSAGAMAEGLVQPCAFIGDVSVNGEPAPVGTVIIAFVNSMNSGSVTIVYEGEYGRNFWDDENDLILVSHDGSDGDIVTFYIQTPAMSSPAKAVETGVWEGGTVKEVNLTATYTPSPPSGGETPPSGGSGGNGGNGGEENETMPGQNETEPEQGLPEPNVTLIDLDASENQTVEMVKAQLGNIKLTGNFYSFRVKSLSDFGVLLTFGDSDVIVNLQESKDVDLTGDYVTDVNISLDSVEDNVAQMTFARLEKNPLGAGTEGISGFLVANPIMGSVMIMVLVVLFGGAYYIYRRRSSK